MGNVGRETAELSEANAITTNLHDQIQHIAIGACALTMYGGSTCDVRNFLNCHCATHANYQFYSHRLAKPLVPLSADMINGSPLTIRLGYEMDLPKEPAGWRLTLTRIRAYVERSAKRRGCFLSYNQAEPGR